MAKSDNNYNNNVKVVSAEECLRKKYAALISKYERNGLSMRMLGEMMHNEHEGRERVEETVSNGENTRCFPPPRYQKCTRTFSLINWVIVASVAVSAFLCRNLFNPDLMMLRSRCILDNNFFLMEMSRPETNCDVCIGVKSAEVLENVTREMFAGYAYSGRPVLAKGAALHWNATQTFSFHFFKTLYQEMDGALDSVEDECQFFPFRTNFITLAAVFRMSNERADGKNGQEPWYIGWSNCNPQVAQILRKHYSRPQFLPSDSESSAIDWIFMGWSGQGASFHLDYVQRPSWQAQLSGRKTWKLLPTPECEHICEGFQVTVEKGDIVLIDTNQWYHDTFVEPGEISISIGSEYD